jgi:protein MAK16
LVCDQPSVLFLQSQVCLVHFGPSSVILTSTCRTTTQNFCRNEYNVTGLCNRQSCPLANSKYATVREKEGIRRIQILDLLTMSLPQGRYISMSKPLNERTPLPLCGNGSNCLINIQKRWNRCEQFHTRRPNDLLVPQIDAQLLHWPNFTIHKCKQRVTKITQYLIKMRRMKLRPQLRR